MFWEKMTDMCTGSETHYKEMKAIIEKLEAHRIKQALMQGRRR